jgi:NAD(P)-dependent dehydrogenase (short-subunit alcohol dehydrogenase family)
MELQNRTAIVTGVSKGIGKNVVLQLLERGAKVAGWGMNEPKYTHENFRFIRADVRKMESVAEAFRQTITHFGEEVHVLINNAGLGYFGFFEEMPEEQFEEIMKVNVYSIFHTCRHVIPQMKKQQYGHIINLSSIAGLEGMPQVAAYCGAKHAVAGITESLFRELRDFGIKVTGIYPGSTNTNFFDNSQGLKAHSGMMAPEEVATQIIRGIETSDNFAVNSIICRPLQVKKK